MFYMICMSILLGPALFVKIPKKIFTPKGIIYNIFVVINNLMLLLYLKNTTEWESEIDEFLPVVTEDNLQLLNRAGETGDHSPTPPSGASSDNPIGL